jgi:hypothetical protein
MKFKTDETRYEFRQFGAGLEKIRDAFAALGEGKQQPRSRETYIVTRLNIESNVKIRGGRLQVKTLEARLGMLEQWARPLDAEFPVAVKDLEEVVLPALGLDLEIGERGAFGEGPLLALLADQPALAIAEVEKSRTLYEIGVCVAEHCLLRIGDDKVETIAIEATDAQAELALLDKVGLGDAPNESYAEFLQRRLFGAKPGP